MPKKIFWGAIVAMALVSFLLGFGLIGLNNSSLNNAVNINLNTRYNGSANAVISENLVNAPENISGGLFHYSNFSDKSFYDKAYEKVGDVQEKGEAIGAIVNHHLLAPDLIAETLTVAATNKPRTVVLISPNHFFAGLGQAILSEYDWQTPYGILEADKDVVSRLAESGAANIDETPFEKEHGISNIVAFIKKAILNAKFVPLIIKDTISENELAKLIDVLEYNLSSDSLIIGSFDFSHYLPSAAADFHDEKSDAILDSLEYQSTDHLDIDSRPGLEILLKIIKARGGNSFTLLGATNSAKILKDEDTVENTSYVTGVFTNGEKEKEQKATALIFGDLMLDRYVRTTIQRKGLEYIFANIERFLIGSDLVLANLEGSFTDFSPNPDPNSLKFTFDPKLIPEIKKFGFNIFNLANNHSLDFGSAGFAQSKEYLKKNNLDYFGDPKNASEISIIKNIRGLKIGFVGFNSFGRKIDPILEEIKRIKEEADIVAVYTHWGAEYNENFTKTQQDQAHAIIDAGADVIFGSHPHVVEPIEEYKGKIIFYSLGNFVFDQLFSEKTQQELAVGAVFVKGSMGYYLFPLESKNIQINLLSGDKKDIILKDLAEKSEVSDAVRKQIQNGKIIINL